jgi:aminoglycoside phosphotransferase (APT) family kinase protein
VKLHDDEVETSPALVEALLAEQFPDLAGPVRAVRSTGTVNAIYRVGEDLYARLPRVERHVQGLHRECEWLPRLAPALALQVPEPVALGRPGAGFPFEWALLRWLEGETYGDVADERAAATALARFVTELRAVPVGAGAPPGGRAPLRELDTVTRDAISSDAALCAWEEALEAPPFTGSPVWIHGDLLRPNLLVHEGRLSAVIDFGSVGVGDPAADVVAAWAVFTRRGRETFRTALGVDDDTWARARGYALHQAALIIPYYAETNPDFVAHAERTVAQVLS